MAKQTTNLMARVQQVMATRVAQPITARTANPLATRFTQKQVLQTTLAAVKYAADNNVSREEEMQLTKGVLKMIEKSEIPQIINELPDELRDVIRARQNQG